MKVITQNLSKILEKNPCILLKLQVTYLDSEKVTKTVLQNTS